jgi:hypothetical protein
VSSCTGTQFFSGIALAMHGHALGDCPMTPSQIAMSHVLSDAEWEELAVLIEEAPPGRVRVAMRRIPVERLNADASVAHVPTGVERVCHLAAFTNGDAIHRALLRELRRLSVH